MADIIILMESLTFLTDAIKFPLSDNMRSKVSLRPVLLVPTCRITYSKFSKLICLLDKCTVSFAIVAPGKDFIVVEWGLYYINTLKQELGSTKTYERISTDERSIVNTHSIDITAKFAVNIKEKQDSLPTLYWLPKLHKRPYKARFIANSSSCTTTVLS